MNSGQSLSATCSVSHGDTPLEFNWYFNSEPISSQDKEDIVVSYNKRRSTLDIEAVRADNSGEYTCSVSNQAGSTTYSTVLTVNGNNLIGVPIYEFVLI